MKNSLSVVEVTQFTGQPKTCFYKLVAQQKIPLFYNPLGGRAFVKQNEPEVYISQNQQEASYEGGAA